MSADESDNLYEIDFELSEQKNSTTQVDLEESAFYGDDFDASSPAQISRKSASKSLYEGSALYGDDFDACSPEQISRKSITLNASKSLHEGSDLYGDDFDACSPEQMNRKSITLNASKSLDEGDDLEYGGDFEEAEFTDLKGRNVASKDEIVSFPASQSKPSIVPVEVVDEKELIQQIVKKMARDIFDAVLKNISRHRKMIGYENTELLEGSVLSNSKKASSLREMVQNSRESEENIEKNESIILYQSSIHKEGSLESLKKPKDNTFLTSVPLSLKTKIAFPVRPLRQTSPVRRQSPAQSPNKTSGPYDNFIYSHRNSADNRPKSPTRKRVDFIDTPLVIPRFCGHGRPFTECRNKCCQETNKMYDWLMLTREKGKEALDLVEEADQSCRAELQKTHLKAMRKLKQQQRFDIIKLREILYGRSEKHREMSKLLHDYEHKNGNNNLGKIGRNVRDEDLVQLYRTSGWSVDHYLSFKQQMKNQEEHFALHAKILVDKRKEQHLKIIHNMEESLSTSMRHLDGNRDNQLRRIRGSVMKVDQTFQHSITLGASIATAERSKNAVYAERMKKTMEQSIGILKLCLLEIAKVCKEVRSLYSTKRYMQDLQQSHEQIEVNGLISVQVGKNPIVSQTQTFHNKNGKIGKLIRPSTAPVRMESFENRKQNQSFDLSPNPRRKIKSATIRGTTGDQKKIKKRKKKTKSAKDKKSAFNLEETGDEKGVSSAEDNESFEDYEEEKDPEKNIEKPSVMSIEYGDDFVEGSEVSPDHTNKGSIVQEVGSASQVIDEVEEESEKVSPTTILSGSEGQVKSSISSPELKNQRSINTRSASSIQYDDDFVNDETVGIDGFMADTDKQQDKEEEAYSDAEFEDKDKKPLTLKQRNKQKQLRSKKVQALIASDELNLAYFDENRLQLKQVLKELLKQCSKKKKRKSFDSSRKRSPFNQDQEWRKKPDDTKPADGEEYPVMCKTCGVLTSNLKAKKIPDMICIDERCRSAAASRLKSDRSLFHKHLPAKLSTSKAAQMERDFIQGFLNQRKRSTDKLFCSWECVKTFVRSNMPVLRRYETEMLVDLAAGYQVEI